MIKGVKVERATPSNAIDIYALVKEAHKEGNVLYPKPTDDQIKGYYLELLHDILPYPQNFTFIARKGRMFMGFIQAQVISRRFGDSPVVFLNFVYVIPKKRKLGVGQGLVDHLMEFMKKDLQITKLEFLCQDESVEYFKKFGAKKVLNHMSVGG